MFGRLVNLYIICEGKYREIYLVRVLRLWMTYAARLNYMYLIVLVEIAVYR